MVERITTLLGELSGSNPTQSFAIFWDGNGRFTIFKNTNQIGKKIANILSIPIISIKENTFIQPPIGNICTIAQYKRGILPDPGKINKVNGSNICIFDKREQNAYMPINK